MAIYKLGSKSNLLADISENMLWRETRVICEVVVTYPSATRYVNQTARQEEEKKKERGVDQVSDFPLSGEIFKLAPQFFLWPGVPYKCQSHGPHSSLFFFLCQRLSPSLLSINR